jgi:predicted PolB exonuclease-like 3'-5' exonuclease
MYNQTDFKDFLFIDIETAGQYQDLSGVSDRLSKLWQIKADFQRKNEDGMQDLSDEDIYEKGAAWFPEFGKIICISIGQIKFDEQGVPQTANIRSFYGDDERVLLEEFNGVMQAVFNKNPKIQLVGHNIKRFDMPWIVKRSLINGLKVPYQFHFQKQKPWENCLLDTYEIWKFGGVNSTSLDLICAALDIPSPKQDISNDQVSDRYWAGELENIKTYCEGDVKATMNVMLRIANLDIL